MLVNFRHLAGAFQYSIAGLRRAWSSEQAFRHEVLLIPIILILLFIIKPGFIWTSLLVFGWLMVMGLELLNSAIEEAFDLISKDFNLHIKYGKDMASAAIFVALCANGLLWIFMLLDLFF